MCGDGETEPPEGTIIAGPTPDACGDVIFQVQVDDRTIQVHAEPRGAGAVDWLDDLDGGNRAVRAVFRFLDEHREQKLSWYREAARLRRQAGNPPPMEPAASVRVQFAGAPEWHGHFAVYRALGAAAEIRVFISNDGGVMDDCDDWSSVSVQERNAAIGAALYDVFERPDRAREMGLDVDLLGEFYR